MARKSQTLSRELIEAANKLKEQEEAFLKIQQEEQELLENTRSNIQKLAEENGFFCGVILTSQDLANIVKLAVDSGEPIKIPFNLYYNE